MEYKVIQEHQRDHLNKEVANCMKVGWVPLGGVAVIGNPYTLNQALIRHTVKPDYRIIRESTPEKVEAEVNAALAKGYKLVGGTESIKFNDAVWFAQAVSCGC